MLVQASFSLLFRTIPKNGPQVESGTGDRGNDCGQRGVLFIRQQIASQRVYDVEGHCWLISGHMSVGRCCVNTSSRQGLPAGAIQQASVNEGHIINRWMGRESGGQFNQWRPV